MDHHNPSSLAKLTNNYKLKVQSNLTRQVQKWRLFVYLPQETLSQAVHEE